MNEYKSLAPLLGGAATLPPPPSPLPGPDEESAQGGMSLTQLLSILRAYWKHSLITILVVMGLSAVIIKMLPKQYVATATLLVNHDNKDPLAGRDIINGLEPTYIPTQIALISSPVVLQPVVDGLKLVTDREFSAGFSGNPGAVREAVMRNLQKAVEVQQAPGSQLLYITATSRNSVKAATLANAVADEYLRQARQRTNQPAGERASRYSQELTELRDKVTDAQDQLTEFRKAHPTIEIDPTKQDVDATALADMEQKLLVAQNQRRQLESQQAHPDTSGPDTLLDSTSVTTLRAKLETQKADMAQLRATLGPRHPKVLELASEMAATSRSLESERQTVAASQADQLARARKLEADYQHAIDLQRAKVVQGHGVQDQAAQLLLELQSAQATYKHALDGYDQIMFASAANFNDITLISRADPPIRAMKPNKVKLLMAATVAAFGLGLGWPFAFELFLNRRIRCRDDLERNFGIPVLAQLGSGTHGSAA